MTSRCGVTMRRRLRDVALLARISPHQRPACGLSNTCRLELVEPFLELLDLRPVVVDHGVDDAVEEGHRPFGHDLPSARRSAPTARRSSASGRRAPSPGSWRRRRSRRRGSRSRARRRGSRCRGGPRRGSRRRLRSSDTAGLAAAHPRPTAGGMPNVVAEEHAVSGIDGAARSTQTKVPLPGRSQAGSSAAMALVRPSRWTK